MNWVQFRVGTFIPARSPVSRQLRPNKRRGGGRTGNRTGWAGWCASGTACCWDIWPGTCAYRTPRESTATAGWTLTGTTMRAFSVRKTLTPWTRPCAAAPARCATVALPRTHAWTRGSAPTTGRWTTQSLLRVSSRYFVVLRSKQRNKIIIIMKVTGRFYIRLLILLFWMNLS